MPVDILYTKTRTLSKGFKYYTNYGKPNSFVGVKNKLIWNLLHFKILAVDYDYKCKDNSKKTLVCKVSAEKCRVGRQ